MRTLKFTLTAFMIVMVAACSDSDGGTSTQLSDDAKPYAKALAAALAKEDGSDLILKKDQADCVAAEWVEVITPERFEENDFDPEKLADPDALSEFGTLGLNEAEGVAMVDGFAECDVDLRGLLLDSFAADEDLTDEVKACLQDGITEEVVERFFLSSLAVDVATDPADPPVAGVAQVITSCTGGLSGS